MNCLPNAHILQTHKRTHSFGMSLCHGQRDVKYKTKSKTYFETHYLIKCNFLPVYKCSYISYHLQCIFLTTNDDFCSVYYMYIYLYISYHQWWFYWQLNACKFLIINNDVDSIFFHVYFWLSMMISAAGLYMYIKIFFTTNNDLCSRFIHKY